MLASALPPYSTADALEPQTPTSISLAEQPLASERAFEDAIRQSQLEAAQTLANEASRGAETLSPTDPEQVIRWHLRAGLASVLLDDAAAARPHYDRACEMARETGGIVEQAQCKAGGAFGAYFDNDQTVGVELAKEALALADDHAEMSLAIILSQLVLAADHLVNKRTAAGEEATKLAADALRSLDPTSFPGLVAMVSTTMEATGSAYAAAEDSEGEVRSHLAAVASLESAIGRVPNLLSVLMGAVQAAALNDRAPEVRMLALEMIEIVVHDEDEDRARAAFNIAITNLKRTFQNDEVLRALWDWHARVERIHGPKSIQAGQSLVSISDWLLEQVHTETAKQVRDRALHVIEMTAGKDSEAYRDAANSIAWQHYQANARTLVEYKENMDEINKRIDDIVNSPLSSPEKEETEKSDATIVAEADQAIAKAKATAGVQGIELLLNSWNSLKKASANPSKTEHDVRQREAERVTSEAWQIAITGHYFDHWTFKQIVTRRATAFEQRGEMQSAIEILAEALNLTRSEPGASVVAVVRTLEAYADVLEILSWSVKQEARDAALDVLGDRFADLLKIADHSSVGDLANAVVAALIQFGKTFEEHANTVQALKAYEVANRVATVFPSDVGEFDKEQVEKALARLREGLDPISAEVAVLRSKLAEMADDDPDKLAQLQSAARHYADIEVNNDYALEFSRAAVKLEKAQIEAIVQHSPISGSAELQDRREYLDDSLMRTLRLLVLSADVSAEKIDEALDLVQWRRSALAGEALSRTTARASMRPELREHARAADQAAIRWRQADRMLRSLAAGRAESNGDVSTISADLSRALADYNKASAALTANSSLYRKISGFRSLTAKDVQDVLRPDEALIAFAYDENRGLWAVLVIKGNAKLVDLSGQYYTETIDTLTSSLKKFQDSFRPKADFDRASAKDIYRILFKPLENYMRQVSHLIVIPDLSFPSLAYPALIGAENSTSPDTGTWLNERFAVTVALSIPSFVAVRLQPAITSSRRNFVGFADPFVEVAGPGCNPISAYGKRRPASGSSRTEPICPMPETLDHVRLLADGLGADPASILSGPMLTEKNVMQKLAEPTRVVAFATHGFVTKEMEKQAGIAEPALLLSPADAAFGDRWLTMGEVESLNIDTDLVVLSACNTSADGERQGEAFSGLARGFFEAGARGILVTNWYVDDLAVRGLLNALKPFISAPVATSAFPRVLQHAMSERMPVAAHPRDWAVFTYIGG